MDDAAVATLGRALGRLGRARASGWLHVVARDRGKIAIRDGRPVSIRSRDGAPLGDLIAAGDAERTARLARALDGPVGRAAVLRGVASPGAVSDAIRRQMRERLAAWFAEPIRDVRFHPGKVGRAPFEEPPSAEDLVLASLRRVSLRRDVRDLRPLADARFRLSPHAQALREAALAPWERAILERVSAHDEGRGVRGAPLVALADPSGSPERGLRILHGWRLLGWLTPVDVARRDHSLLLRKRHQLRRRASPARLLDLDGSTRDQGPRRALRRLAAQVHPDRFEGDLAETSDEVLRGLLDAADRLREG
ncbi:MAG: hypothetical protein CMN30_09490 [Sandaracinus sp.]|nr:hypothetical protein [Sandaracinus sp.]